MAAPPMAAENILAAQGFSNVALLGQGAYGSVFRCTSAKGESVAVKLSFEREARDAAQQEARLMSAIPPHKNVLPLLSFSDSAKHTALALPLATGGDTLKLMQERSCEPLPEQEVRELFAQLVDAVSHLHENGFVHRDIKCENVLLTGTRRRTVLLADFGFAARFSADKKLDESCGSLHYSSPEICAQVSYEPTSVDIWSMGVVLFAWATGRLPFGGRTDEELVARIMGGVYAVPARCSPDLTELIRGMLHVETAQRFTVEKIRSHPWMQQAKCIARSSSEKNYEKPVAPLKTMEEKRNSSPNVKAPSPLGEAARGLLRAILRH